MALLSSAGNYPSEEINGGQARSPNVIAYDFPVEATYVYDEANALDVPTLSAFVASASAAGLKLAATLPSLPDFTVVQPDAAGLKLGAVLPALAIKSDVILVATAAGLMLGGSAPAIVIRIDVTVGPAPTPGLALAAVAPLGIVLTTTVSPDAAVLELGGVEPPFVGPILLRELICLDDDLAALASQDVDLVGVPTMFQPLPNVVCTPLALSTFECLDLTLQPVTPPYVPPEPPEPPAPVPMTQWPAHHWTFINQLGAAGSETPIKDLVLVNPGDFPAWPYTPTDGSYANGTADGTHHVRSGDDPSVSSNWITILGQDPSAESMSLPFDDPSYATLRAGVSQILVDKKYPNSPFSTFGGSPHNPALLNIPDMFLPSRPLIGYSVKISGLHWYGPYYNNRFGTIPPSSSIQLEQVVLSSYIISGGNPRGWWFGQVGIDYTAGTSQFAFVVERASGRRIFPLDPEADGAYAFTWDQVAQELTLFTPSGSHTYRQIDEPDNIRPFFGWPHMDAGYLSTTTGGTFSTSNPWNGMWGEVAIWETPQHSFP